MRDNQNIRVFAPAKINLYLHVTSKRPDGYHCLESLVAFTDVGDEITIALAGSFSFAVSGPFAKNTPQDETNLAVQAAKAISAHLGQPLDRLSITLTKNLPVASGIGGGSSDAAATIHALLQCWGYNSDEVEGMPALLEKLGADVPMCFYGKAARVTGIGETLAPYKLPQSLSVVLVNPGIAVPTAQIFRALDSQCFSKPEYFDEQAFYGDFIQNLHRSRNDLYAAAKNIAPDITNVMPALQAQKGCDLARMSGSGATCFGLFKTPDLAEQAANSIANENPAWWVQQGTLK